VRRPDLLVLKKHTDGSLEAFELLDIEETEVGELRSCEADMAMLLGEDDVEAVAESIEPGRAAACIFFEDGLRLASAMRRVGGQLVADGRAPVQALLAASAADEAEGA
jgi:hypothetical protein